jgi:hypothetical protein
VYIIGSAYRGIDLFVWLLLWVSIIISRRIILLRDLTSGANRPWFHQFMQCDLGMYGGVHVLASFLPLLVLMVFILLIICFLA